MPIPRVRYSRTGPKGLAKVKTKRGRIIVTMDRTGRTYEFDAKDESALRCQPPAKDGDLFVQISEDGKVLLSARPFRGTFHVKFAGLAKPEGQLPMPKHYEGVGTRKDGKTFVYSYDAFNTLLEVTRGDWEGTVFVSLLRYLFTDAGDGETTGVYSGGKHATMLMAFLELAGLDLDDGHIPYSDNVLPWLDDHLMSKADDNEFVIIVDKGYVQAFGPTGD